jgi:hypothetical protein
LIEEVGHLDWVSFFSDCYYICSRWLESCRDANALGGFKLVACKHPQLDSCSSQLLDGVEDLVLQLIFNSRDAKQFHILFELLE